MGENLSFPTCVPSQTPLVSMVNVNNPFPAALFSVEDRQQGWVILHILGLVYMFLSLVLVCDHFFVPALNVIMSKLAISADVAGATFMAAGRSFPNLLVSLIGASISSNPVKFGSIVGPAVFNILFVISMCGFCSKDNLLLTKWPVFRDVSFYSFDLIFLTIFYLDSVISWWESLILIILYVLYVSFMKFNVQAEKAFKNIVCQQKCMTNKDMTIENKMPEDPEMDRLSERHGVLRLEDCDVDNSGRISRGLSEKDDGTNKVEQQDNDEHLVFRWPNSRCKQVRFLFLFPIILPLWLTIPDVRKQKCGKFFVVTFLMSIFWIVVFSYLSTWWAHQVGETFGDWHVVHFLVGVVSNPGLIISVIVARKGLGDMVVSNNIGANIFEITMSLPLAWLLFSCLHGFSPAIVTSNGLVCAIMLLFVMIFFAVISIVLCKWKMTRVFSSIMLSLYILFVIISVLFAYRFIVCPAA